MTVETLYPFLYALIAGGSYAAIWFVLKVYDSTKPEVGWSNFDKVSFLVTVCFGAGIGLINVFTGSPITQADITIQLAAYGTQIAVAREVVVFVYRQIQVYLASKKVE